LHVDNGGAGRPDKERIVDHVLVALGARVPFQNTHRRVLQLKYKQR